MIVSLIGFMGCGKSTLARLLWKGYDVGNIDLDQYIETAEGRSVKDIFSSDGEAHFRSLEVKYLSEIVRTPYRKDIVLALGGGTPTIDAAAEIIKNKTFGVYLKASVDTLLANLLETDPTDRPMLGGETGEAGLRKKIESLMAAREAAYMSCSKYVVNIDGREYDGIAGEIMRNALGCQDTSKR